MSPFYFGRPVMRVEVIVPALRDQQMRDYDEPWFCDLNDYRHSPPGNCDGVAELRVEVARQGKHGRPLDLCRACAEDLLARLRSAIELADMPDDPRRDVAFGKQ